MKIGSGRAGEVCSLGRGESAGYGTCSSASQISGDFARVYRPTDSRVGDLNRRSRDGAAGHAVPPDRPVS